MPKFLIRDADGNPAAIVYAANSDRARGEYVENSEVHSTDVFKLEVEDITDVPMFGTAGIDDRDISR